MSEDHQSLEHSSSMDRRVLIGWDKEAACHTDTAIYWVWLPDLKWAWAWKKTKKQMQSFGPILCHRHAICCWELGAQHTWMIWSPLSWALGCPSLEKSLFCVFRFILRHPVTSERSHAFLHTNNLLCVMSFNNKCQYYSSKRSPLGWSLHSPDRLRSPFTYCMYLMLIDTVLSLSRHKILWHLWSFLLKTPLSHLSTQAYYYLVDYRIIISLRW